MFILYDLHELCILLQRYKIESYSQQEVCAKKSLVVSRYERCI